MTSIEVRQKFIDFFTHPKRAHKEISPAPLIPENDPTTLFTSSGMQQLVPYLMGESHPQGKRLVDSQPCLRLEDIDEVGNNRHTTFFEMLGNWSLGDYFKKEQLSWFLQFLTEELTLPLEKLYVTCFEGNGSVPKDEESAQIWRDLGIPPERISFYGADKNWWSRSGPPEKMPSGEIGGPSSEVFYDFGTPHNPKWGEKCHPNCDCGRFWEIGNSVFIQYVKQKDGSLQELPQKNVDFGGGLERITAVVNENPDIFAVDLFTGAREILEEVNLDGNDNNIRIILDHIRATAFIIATGIEPSNKEQGYVLRRLIRRAALHAKLANIDLKNNLTLMINKFGQAYNPSYPNISDNKGQIIRVILGEMKSFQKTLRLGMKKVSSFAHGGAISGQDAFNFYQTYGYPLELLQELASKQDLKVDVQGFKEAQIRHQKKSHASAQKKFAGGLADHSEKTTRLHTATHLLHQALRDTLGPQVQQKGSNITAKRLRFDFNSDRKLTDTEIARIEKIVNQKIVANLPVTATEKSFTQAQKEGALAFFTEHYDGKVKIYSIGNYSKEVCGGPHVKHTGELGVFKILKQESVGKGVRRIKAVLE